MVCDTRPDQISFPRCMQMNSCGGDAPFMPDPDNPFTEDDNDMVYNYMDGGSCRSAFTMGQIERMHWALGEYKPGLIQSDFSNVDNCSVSQVGFALSSISNPIVGTQLLFENNNTDESFIHRWYIDGNLVSQQTHLSTTFTENKVYRIRLETAVNQGACKDIFWAYQLELPIKCADQAVQLKLPKSMRIDSCYEVRLDFASDIVWNYADEFTQGSKIQLCPSNLGVQKLEVSYLQGACTVQDSFFFFVHDSVQLRHYFTNYKMPFAQDTASTPLITALENVDKQTYLIFGAEYFNRSNIDEDTTNAFLRFWHPDSEQAIHWDLFHIAENDLSNEYGFFPNMQLFPTDMVLDSLGNIYFIAFESYSRYSDMTKYILGRINVNGKLQWAKRILMPYSKVTSGLPSGQAEISIDQGDLFLHVFSDLYHFDLSGKLNKAVTIKMSPDSLYASGVRFFDPNMDLKNGIIRIASKIILLNPEDYLPFDDDLVIHINENTNFILTTNLDFDSLQYQYYSIDDDLVRSEVVTSTDFKDGTLFLFKDSERVLGSNSFFTLSYLDKNNLLVNSKQYSISEGFFTSASFEQVELFVLNNNDILLVTRTNSGRKVLYMRFNSTLELIEHRIYEPPFLDQPFGTERTSRLRYDNNSSQLVEDGILFSTLVDERKQDKLYFHHLPLDSNFVQCEQIFHQTNLDTLPITKPKTEPHIWLEPIQLAIEDIDLHIRKSVVDVGLADCRSSYVLNDYYFGAIDSTCIDLQTIQFDIQVCRDNVAELDSLSLNVYNTSPLMVDTEPIVSTAHLFFEENQKCVAYKLFLPAGDYHFLLNAQADYPLPFTLTKTFFDAHESMESDYSNNIRFVGNKNCFFTNVQSSSPKDNLIIYPNPTKRHIHIQSVRSDIQNIKMYTLAGQLILDRSFAGKNISLQEDFVPGVYIIKASLQNGNVVNTKLVVSK